MFLKGGRLPWLLLEHTEGMLSGKIAGSTGITSERVANLLKQMGAKGLIYRMQGTDDKRKTKVFLSGSGKIRAEQVKQENIVHDARVLEELGEKDAQTLIRLFAKYLDMKAKQRQI